MLKRMAPFYSAAGDGTANYLTKYSEKITWLTDVNQDGTAESAMVVAEAFRDSMEGPGSTLLALPQGHWFFGSSPVLWRLHDQGDDQRAEERTPVAEGFGLRNAPADAGVNALLEAPDGWIYWAVGERGYDLRQGDGRRVRGLGSGAIFRCRPDGLQVERIAQGLRNPRALAMLPDGQLLAMDEAAPGGKTRFLAVIPGADFAWQAESVTAPGKGVWFDEAMEFAATDKALGPPPQAWITPMLGHFPQPCAAMALSPNGTLLTADSSPGGGGGLHEWKVADSGYDLTVKDPQVLWRGGAVLALTVDAEGTVFFADWGEEVDAQSRCRIRRALWPTPPAPGPPPEKPATLIRRLPETSVRILKTLLAHPSPRVALRARQRLESLPFQESLEALLQVARRGPSLTARLHALRGAGAAARQDAALLNEILPFLTDDEPAIRAVAATQIGEGSYPSAPAGLRRALTDEARVVRLAAAASLARLKATDALTDLLGAAAANLSKDGLIRHSLAHALAEAVPPAALAAAAATLPSVEARLTVLLALRRTGAMETSFFLTDSDPMVATEAARAVYDLPIRLAYAELANLLERPDMTEPVLRRALRAAAFVGTLDLATLVGSFATAPSTPVILKSAALATLESWDAPPTEDPIWHRAEIALPRAPGIARAAARLAAEALKPHEDARLAAQSIQLLKSPAANPLSVAARLALLQNPAAPTEERLATLTSLIAGNHFTPEIAKTFLPPTDPLVPTGPAVPTALRAEARAFLMRRDPKSAPLLLSEALATGSPREKQVAVRTLDYLPGQGGDNEKLVLELARRLGAGGIEPAIQVEVLEALQRRDIESRSPWRKATEAYQASLPTHFDPLAPWYMAMEDGDPSLGRILFETRQEAACLTCHSLHGIGGLKGPDLDGVASRLTKGMLLESLIRPGTKLAKGHPVASQLESAAEPDSIMPPMGTLLTLRELRDLMAFLITLKEP